MPLFDEFGKSGAAPLVEGDRGGICDMFRSLGDSAGQFLGGILSKETGQAVGQSLGKLIGGNRGTDSPYPTRPQPTFSAFVSQNKNWLLLAGVVLVGGLVAIFALRK